MRVKNLKEIDTVSEIIKNDLKNINYKKEEEKKKEKKKKEKKKKKKKKKEEKEEKEEREKKKKKKKKRKKRKMIIIINKTSHISLKLDWPLFILKILSIYFINSYLSLRVHHVLNTEIRAVPNAYRSE